MRSGRGPGVVRLWSRPGRGAVANRSGTLPGMRSPNEWEHTRRAGGGVVDVAPSAHQDSGGACAACGSPWPCASAQRSGMSDGSAPCGVPLSSMIGGAGGCVGERRRPRHRAVGKRVRAAARSVVLGYVRLRPGEGAASVVAGIAGLEAFADSWGWMLGEIFVDDDPARPLLAWANLTAAAGGLSLAAVLVPDAPGLRPPSLALEHLRARCAREILVPLLLAPPALTPERSRVRESSVGVRWAW